MDEISEIYPSFKELKENGEKQIHEGVSSELKPFLNEIYGMEASSREFQKFRENYSYFVNKFQEGSAIFRFLLTAGEVPLSDIKSKIYLIFNYLGAVESLGNAFVDLLVMLLIANGIDFHIECRYTTPRIKHATTIKELENERVALTTKLNFLKENDITSFTSIIDSTLRNDIAHLNFTIRKNDIFIRGKPAVPMVIEGIFKLVTVFETVTDMFVDLNKTRKLIIS